VAYTKAQEYTVKSAQAAYMDVVKRAWAQERKAYERRVTMIAQAEHIRDEKIKAAGVKLNDISSITQR